MSDDVAAIVAAAWAKNRPTVIERLGIMADAVDRLRDGTLSADEREHARSLAHKLAGSLGMYGFPDASALAGKVEAALDGADGDLAGLGKALGELRVTLESAPMA